MARTYPKPGIATIALRKYDIFSAISIAAKAGFQGIEIWGKPPHTPQPVDWEYEKAIARNVEENCLQVSMFGSYVNTADDEWKDKAKQNIRICKILGAPIMRIWAGNIEPKDADGAYWSETIFRLKELCKMGEDAGIKMGVEMHGGTLTATIAGCERLLQEVNHPNLKFNLQFTDFTPTEFFPALPIFGPHIVNIHAQNWRITNHNGQQHREISLIEEGEIDYLEVLTQLAKYNFDGFIEVEFLKGENESEKILLESLERDANYLIKICNSVSANS
jgi:sugar phosphate isomerase/epimerase